jgi:transposase-like protein
MTFKEEAIKLLVEGGLTVANAAHRLSISYQTLKNWVTKHSVGDLALWTAIKDLCTKEIFRYLL